MHIEVHSNEVDTFPVNDGNIEIHVLVWVPTRGQGSQRHRHEQTCIGVRPGAYVLLFITVNLWEAQHWSG